VPDLPPEPNVQRAPRASRRRIVLVAATAVVVLVVGIAVLVLRGDGDGDDADTIEASPAIAVADHVAGELTWERDDLIATAGSVGPTLLSTLMTDADEFRFQLLDLLTGELRLDTSASPIRIWSDGDVLLYDERGERLLVDVATGEERWRTGVFVVDDPSGGVVVGREDERVVAFDVASGTELWHADTDLDTGPWIDEGLVLWAADDGTLHALGALDGREVWTVDGYRLDGNMRAPSPTDIGTPEPDDGVVLVAGEDGLTGLDPADGTERWSIGPWNPELVPVAVVDGTIVAAIGDDYGPVEYVGLDPGTGAERWRFDPAAGPVDASTIQLVGPGAIGINTWGDEYDYTVVDLARAGVIDAGPDACCVFAVGADDVLVATDTGALAVLARDGGDERWATGSTDGFQYGVLVGDTVVAVSARGEVVGLALDDGHQVWRQAVELDAAALVPTGSGVVVLGDPTGVALIR
jgi:outer membrane protein assembly factor BamB